MQSGPVVDSPKKPCRPLRAAAAACLTIGEEVDPDRIVAVYPPGGHGFPIEAREEAYRFVDQVLGMDRKKR